MTIPQDRLERRIRQRLEQLRERFVAVNLRSRSVRLRRTSRTGAFDLWRLREDHPDALERLVDTLGSPDAHAIRMCVLESDSADSPADDIGRLARAAREERLETGADSLAVGWPILEGVCADGTWLRAPVLLFPVTLEKTSTGRLGWTLAPRGAPEVNEPLTQTLGRLEGLRLDRSELLEVDDDGLAVDEQTWAALHTYLSDADLAVESTPALPELSALAARTAEDTNEAAASQAGMFRLHHHLVLGRFPLSASSIVLDYDELLDTEGAELVDDDLGLARDLLLVDESDIEAAELRDSDSAAGPDEAGTADDSGATLGELRRWQVLASDASQDAVFRHLESLADEGSGERGLVVQGPPGTGKSQLIANLIAASVAQGQRVLLVCPKRAALDVVANRLAHLGLEEPVAVVHDVQHDRTEVGTAIARTLGQGVSASEFDAAGLGQQMDAAAADHSRAMDRLEARVAAAQASYACLTGRDVPRPGLAELLERALDDDGRELPDLSRFAEAITPRAVDRNISIVESMAPETRTLAAPHPLARRGDWSGLDKADIDEVFARCARIDELLVDMQKLGGELLPGEAAERSDLWRDAAPLLDLFDGDADGVDDFALFWVWTDGEAATGQWRQVMSRLERAREELSPVPYQLIMATREQLDQWREGLERLAELRQHWYRIFVPEFWRLRSLPGQILEHCAQPDEETSLPVDVARLVEDALEWHDFLEELPSDNPLFNFGFDGQPDAIDGAIETLETQHRRVEYTHRLHQALKEAGGAYAELPRLDTAAAEVPFFQAARADRAKAELLEQLDEALVGLEEGLNPSLRQTLRALAASGEFDAARTHIGDFMDARPDALEAARQDQILDERPAWVVAFLRRWRPGEHATGDVSADLRQAVERCWIEAWLDDRSVRSVEAPLLEKDQRQQLGEALKRCQQVADRGIIARFYARLVEAFTADRMRRRAMRKLGSEAKRKRSRKTLRQLVSEYWDRGLSMVRPVWCCSPESVAAMFPLRAGLFDLVIFDEASQCPVESALPALLRARSAVIAGDDQQMPPSHFFQAAPELADDEDSSLLASVSVLALARATYPGVTLRWHYRSRHEELVAFSNAAFYEGRLVTAPSSEPAIRADIEGLHFERVDGLWEDNQNTVEADHVVDLVERLLGVQGPDGRPPTVGVVTFNRNQAELVEQRLDARAAAEPIFARRLARDRQRAAVDQLFVRNLENVQGDERDIIIMSPGYGPTEPGGPVHARFGPLNLSGGEKRLNVAITRARLGLWLVTSIEPERLDVSNTTHAGPRVFEAYLRFVRAHASGDEAAAQAILASAGELGAGRGGVARATNKMVPGRPTGARVVDELADALEKRGLHVRREVGLGSQNLDLAVRRDADQPWRVGVDCREFLRHADPLARDVYTPAFWERQGWSIMRVSPGMWLERPTEVVDTLAEQCRAVELSGTST